MSALRLRLVAALAGLALAICGLAVGLAASGTGERSRAALEHSTLARASLLAELVRGRAFDPASREELAALVARSATDGDRISVIGSDGALFADSELRLEELASAPNLGNLPEVRSALAGQLGTRAEVGERPRLYVAVPTEAAAPGALRLAVPLDAGGADWLRALLLGGAAALLAAGALAALLADRLGRRLSEIRAALGANGAAPPSARSAASADPFAEITSAARALGLQLEQRLRDVVQEKERLQAVLGGMVEGVLVVDREGRIELANRELRELFALHGEVEGRSVLEVIRSAPVQEALEEARRTGEPVRREVSFETPQRRVFEIRAACMPAFGRNGALAVFHDVTEMRRLEAVRRDFVANASHELRTPLTAIRGFAETLVASEVPPAERGRYLRIILDHSERIESLVDDLLDLSRLERDTVQLQFEVLDLEPVVRGVLENLSQVFADRKLSARCAELKSPPVWADRRAVEQILYNLLDNAAKYTEPGGRVEVRAETRGTFVRLSVSDTGIGIPEADRVRIFERFYRVDKARSRALGGTGLGLAIVRHLVEHLGGEISVESEPAKGSTFTVSLKRHNHVTDT